MTEAQEKRESKLRVFAGLWAHGKRPKVILYGMRRLGCRVSMSWVRAKISRIKKF